MPHSDQPFMVREVVQAGWENASPDQVGRIALRALAAPQSDGWVHGSRIIETSDGALMLQCASVGDAAQGGADPVAWDRLADHTRKLIAAADDDPDAAGSDDRDDPFGLALLEAIEEVLLSIDALAPALSLDDEQPAILLAPEAADWAIAITTIGEAGWVRALLPLKILPDDSKAQCDLMRQALRINDLRLLGADCSIIVNVEADLLLLQVLVPAQQADPDRWTGLFGRMLALREAMLEEWDSTEASSVRVGAASEKFRDLHSTALRV